MHLIFPAQLTLSALINKLKMDKLYVIFYCLVRNDQTNTVHSRTIYLIEIFLSQVFFVVSEVIIGLLDLRFNSFIFYVAIGIFCLILSCFLINKSFNKDRCQDVIQKYSELISRRKVYLVLLGTCLFIGAFILLILGGMLMSYLFSLYE